MEGAVVADAKEAGAPASKGAYNSVESGYIKGLASSVEGTVVADVKEAGAPDAKGAFTPVDAGSVNNVAADESMDFSLEASAVATADNNAAYVEVVATFVDACSTKYVAAVNDVDSAVADSKDVGAV